MIVDNFEPSPTPATPPRPKLIFPASLVQSPNPQTTLGIPGHCDNTPAHVPRRRIPLRRPHALPALRRLRPAAAPPSPSACGTTSAHVDDLDEARRMMHRAFDRGITHFDLANNYGPPPGSAEENAGRILAEDFACHRDELVISTKAGHLMWDGPYGEWGSRKHLLSSLDQSLRRLRLDYVDIFYSHRPDPDTPLEETIGALVTAVQQRQGPLRRPVEIPAETAPPGGQDARAKPASAAWSISHHIRSSTAGRRRTGILDWLDDKNIGCSSSARSPRECSPASTSTAFRPIHAPPGPTASSSPTRSRPASTNSAPSPPSPPKRGHPLHHLALRWVVRNKRVDHRHHRRPQRRPTRRLPRRPRRPAT